jgi:hypothetical protein
MNAFLQIVSQLVESVPGSMWLEQRYFPFKELKNPRGRLFDAVFFERGAQGALGIVWISFENYDDELVTLPFRLSRYSEDGDLIVLPPWSLREASGDSALYEAWRRAQHVHNPMRTEKEGRFTHRFVNGEPNLVALSIWSDTRNTCVRLESQEAYKIFRTFHKLQPDSIEVDILEALGEQTIFLNFPRLISVFEYSSKTVIKAHCAISTRYLHNQGTLWQDLSVRVQHARFPQHLQESSSHETWNSVLRTAEQLGRLLGEFHRAMTAVRDNPRLQPESNAGAAREHWLGMLKERAQWRLDEVIQTSHVLFGGVFNLSKAQRYKERMLAAIEKMNHLGLLLRVHGHAHLGQILVSNDTLYLLDFECDWLDDPKYREQKQSGLKDVASVLLSLKYCWMSSERSAFSHVFVDFLDPESEFGKHVSTKRSDYIPPKTYHPTFQDLESVFLRFYRQTIQEDSGSTEVIPVRQDDFTMLLRFYYFLRILKETLRDYNAGNPRAKLSLRILEEFVEQDWQRLEDLELKETLDQAPAEPGSFPPNPQEETVS